MLLVDNRSGGLEPLPDRLAVLLVDGAVFLPLVVELLDLAECRYSIVAFCQSLCPLAKFLLGFEVLLEIEVAELAVDLYIIIESFYIMAVGLIEVLGLGGRYGACRTPPVLQFPECGICSAEVTGIVDQHFELVDDPALGLVVLFLLLVELLDVFTPDGLVLTIKILETSFYLCERID